MMTPMESRPVTLNDALAQFDEIYSPRIVGRVNDYDIRIAHTKGEHMWHVHDHTDEFFLVLDGQFNVALRDADRAEPGNELEIDVRGKRRRAVVAERQIRPCGQEALGGPWTRPPLDGRELPASVRRRDPARSARLRIVPVSLPQRAVGVLPRHLRDRDAAPRRGATSDCGRWVGRLVGRLISRFVSGNYGNNEDVCGRYRGALGLDG